MVFESAGATANPIPSRSITSMHSPGEPAVLIRLGKRCVVPRCGVSVPDQTGDLVRVQEHYRLSTVRLVEPCDHFSAGGPCSQVAIHLVLAKNEELLVIATGGWHEVDV